MGKNNLIGVSVDGRRAGSIRVESFCARANNDLHDCIISSFRVIWALINSQDGVSAHRQPLRSDRLTLAALQYLCMRSDGQPPHLLASAFWQYQQSGGMKLFKVAAL